MTSESGIEPIGQAMAATLQRLAPDKSTTPVLRIRRLDECNDQGRLALLEVEWKRMSGSTYAARDGLEDFYARIQRDAERANCFDVGRIDTAFFKYMADWLLPKKKDKAERFVKTRGVRYENCTFENYAADTPVKASAVEKLKAYARDPSNITTGNGVILFGPRGTGKDHLVTALARQVVETCGASIEWVNGLDLYGAFRDAFSERATKSEREVIATYTKPDVLYVSDPLPPIGALSEFQMGSLFRILDSRYCNCKTTWITVNVQDGAELDARLGPQNGDRLRDGALAIYCNWPSHRKAIQ